MGAPDGFDAAAFLDAAGAALDEHAVAPSRTTAGHQAVYEFYHPLVVDALGTDGVAASFNRSGVVWAPPAGRLAVELRVPAARGDAVAGALAAAPVDVGRSDHRGVPDTDGEAVTVLHLSGRADGCSREDVVATLAAVADALAV